VSNPDKVILVDEYDQEIGTANKLEAHLQGGQLHRAISVFILNDRAEMLLQQRAAGKYHFPGLWSNSCCTHPMPGERTIDAAHRRLQQEMGFDCPLKKLFTFNYQAGWSEQFYEKELDHVFIGQYEGDVQIDPNEADAFRWMSIAALTSDIAARPSHYTPWFQLSLPMVLQYHRFPELIVEN
jgi:isopentenyl-diphosphate delta-isomerase